MAGNSSACDASAPGDAGKAAASGAAENFPALTGRVVDEADLLAAADETALSSRSAALENRAKHQFVIATISDLGGRDIADYARGLGNRWRVGRRCANDGVLLVVAPNERKVRIAVGDGLRRALTDAEAATIIETRILPEFRAGRMREGILAGSDAIITEISQ